MITIAKLGVGAAQDYYRSDFSVNRYYAATEAMRWQGRYAAEMGLVGLVREEQFERLTNGQDPWTGEQLIHWRGQVPAKEHVWVRDNGAWREHLESLVSEAMEAGIDPLTGVPQTPGLDAYKLADAIHWVLAKVEQSAPNLRQEMDVWLHSHLQLPMESSAKSAGTEQHIACWDITLRAHKSVSLVALVGRDHRMVDVVRQANDKAIRTLEKYLQARMGGNHCPETTAKWIIATAEHDTARPVEGYAAPLLHHHNLVMNMTADATGQVRALWSKEFYKAQMLAESVFQGEVALGALRCGYRIRQGHTHATEIDGISQEYIDAESPRHRVIQEKLAELGMEGSVEAGKLVALETREKKLSLTHEQQQAVHQLHADQFGCEAGQVVNEAMESGPQPHRAVTVAEAVRYARARQSERFAVFEHYNLVRDALVRGWGSLTVEQVETEVERLRQYGELVAVRHFRGHAPEYRYTTPEQLRTEREVIEMMIVGQYSMSPIWETADLSGRSEFRENPKRLRVLESVLRTPDKIVGINGRAGSAKTSSMKLLAELAREHGYQVEGLAPTGTAVESLSKQGIRAQTVQRYLLAEEDRPEKVLFLLDEASLVSGRQMHKLFRKLGPSHRVMLVGDDAPTKQVGQHNSIEAGRPFWQLQAAGMRTAYLHKNYRQKTPELREVVNYFRHGETASAIDKLSGMGGIRAVQNRHERFAAIGKWVAEDASNTLVVVPDNESRQEINQSIRKSLRDTGALHPDGVTVEVLVPRDVLDQDRTRARHYMVGDVLRYVRDIESLGVHGKEYGTVVAVNREGNSLTVKMEDGRYLVYNPSRTGSGVSVFEKRRQEFSRWEQVQFTAPDKSLNVSNRTTGSIQRLAPNGDAEIRLHETGRIVQVNLHQHRHLEYGYTSTSHSAQARTVHRCAVEVDTDNHRIHGLIHQVFSYVAASRPEWELAVFTDREEELARVMGREHSVPTGWSLDETKAMGKEKTMEMGMAV